MWPSEEARTLERHGGRHRLCGQQEQAGKRGLGRSLSFPGKRRGWTWGMEGPLQATRIYLDATYSFRPWSARDSSTLTSGSAQQENNLAHPSIAGQAGQQSLPPPDQQKVKPKAFGGPGTT